MDGPLSFEEFQKCIQSGVFPGAVVPLSHVPPSSNSPAVPDGIEIVVEDDDEESSKPSPWIAMKKRSLDGRDQYH